MTRRWRRAAILGLTLAGGLALAGVAAGTPWARHALLNRIASSLEHRYGVVLHAGQLDLRLHALALTFHDVSLAAGASPGSPVVRALRVDVDLGRRALLGRLVFDRVTVTRPHVVFDLTDSTPSRVPSAGPPSELEIGLLDIQELGVDATLAPGVHITTRDVRVSGSGTGSAADLTVAVGSLEVDAPPARVRYDRMSAQLSVRDGTRLAFTVLADSEAATFRVEGTAGLAEDGGIDGRYDAALDLAELARLIEGAPHAAGVVRVRGTILGPVRNPVVTFQALGSGVAWAAVRGARFEADGALEARRLRLSGHLDAGALGSLVAHGALALDAGAPSVLRAAWTTPDVGRWAALTHIQLRRVAGTGEAEWRWLGFRPAPETLDGSARMVVHGVGPRERPEARLELITRGGRCELVADAAFAGATRASGRATIDLTAHPPGRSPLAGTIRLESANVTMALGELRTLGLPVPQMSIEGRDLVLSGELGGTLEAPSVRGAVEGTAVIAPFQRVSVGAMFHVDRDGVRVDPLTFRTAGGEAEARGELRFADLATTGTLYARLVRLDPVGTWLPAGWHPTGSASLSLDWGGTARAPIATIRAQASDVAARGLRVNQVRAELELAGRTLRLRDLTLAQLAGSLSAGGEIDLESGAFSLDARASGFAAWSQTAASGASGADVPAVTQNPGLSDLHFLARTTGSLSPDPGNRSVRLDLLDFDGLVLGRRATLEGTTTVSYRDDEIVVTEPARITFGGTRLRMAGGWGERHPEGLDVTVEGSIEDLLTLLPRDAGTARWAGEGPLRARLSVGGSRQRPSISGSGSLAIASLRRGDQEIARDVSIAARVTRDAIIVNSITGLALGGAVDGSASIPLDWLLGPAPGWEGTALRPGGVDVRSGLPSTHVSSGSNGPPAQASLRGTWHVDVAEARRALGLEIPELRGSATLVVAAAARYPRLEAVEASISGTLEGLSGRALPLLERAPFALRVTNGRLVVNSLDWHGREAQIRASGSLALTPDEQGGPDAGRPGPAGTLHVVVESTLRLLDEFLPVRASGNVSAELSLDGSPGAWRPTGTIVLTDCSLVDPRRRLALADWSGRFGFGLGHLQTERIAGQLNGGEVEVAGTLAWRDGTRAAPLTVRARDVLLEAVPGLRTQVDADLTLAAGPQAGALSGAVTLTADAYREEVSAIASTVAAFASRARPSSAELPAWLASTSLDVRLDAANPVVIENRMAQFEILPALRIVGTIGEPALAGRAEIVPDGRVQAAGRRYRLEDSAIEFSGRSLIPALNVSGRTKVGSYDVTLRLTGPADAIETSLSSDPPLSQRDLRSLLLTGQTTDLTGTTTGSGDFVMGAVSGDVLGVAGRFIGLDSITVGTDDFELVSDDVKTARRLTVSKRLGTRFELLFSENLEDDELTWILIYRPRHGWDVRVSSRDNVEQGLEVRREFTFGPGVAAVSPLAPRAASPPETVSEVVVTGESGFAVPDVLRGGRLEAGDRFVFADWWRDRDRIEATYRDRGYFAARVVPKRTVTSEEPRRVRLEYRIVRGPRTELQVVGYDAPPALIDRLELAWSTAVVPEFLPDRLSAVVRRHLVEAGHLRAEVQVDVSRPDDTTYRSVVRIVPGPILRARRVAFSGNAAITTAELDAIAGPLAEVDAWLDPTPLVSAIRSEYQARGYPGARVEVGAPEFSATTATLLVAIAEGPRLHVGTVRVNGVTPDQHDEALTVIDLAPAAPVTPAAVRQARARLERHYRDLGYRDARVTAAEELDHDAGTLDLTLSVATGQLFVVREVVVEGAQTTRDSLVRSALTLAPGDPAGASAVVESERRLHGLGVFRSAAVQFEPTATTAAGGAIAEVDARVRLEESRRYQLRFGVQTTSEYEPALTDRTNAAGVAIDVRDRNFAGRAISLGAGLRYEPSLQSFRTLLAVPRLGTAPVRTSVYGIWRRESSRAPSDREYWDDTAVLAIEQRWQARRSIELAWGYRLDWRDVRLAESPLTERRGFEGVLGSLYSTVTFDRRDSALDATRGWFQSASLQWGSRELGSTIDFLRLHFRSSVYVPLGPVVLASAARVGTVTSFGGRPGPNVEDLFFKTGGTQSVRGYAEDALSAVELQGIPFGGTRVLVLNGELRFPIVWRLGGVLFTDAGNTFATNGFDLSELKLGVGFGLRLKTPLAPIRLDVGWPERVANERRSPRWHFSIGQMF